jgi:hypothetical protein
VIEARTALLAEVDGLGGSTRAALDIPAKVRRNPTKIAAGVGGLAFLLVGGPQRSARRVTRILRGGRPPTPKAVLPDEIDRLVRDLGGDTDLIRARLDREFANYLAGQKRGGRLRSGASNTFWRGANVFTTVIAARSAGELARRLFAVDDDKVPEDDIPSDEDLDGV